MSSLFSNVLAVPLPRPPLRRAPGNISDRNAAKAKYFSAAFDRQDSGVTQLLVREGPLAFNESRK